MPKYVLAIDQGTTSSRAVLFDESGRTRGLGQRAVKQIFPRPGLVEQDPDDMWQSVMESVQEALADGGAGPRDLAAIGITNQRETTLVWDREDGRPIHNAIVWQDRRTAEAMDELKLSGKEGLVRGRTGLVLDAYFSASKVEWILDNVDGARALAEEDRLAFGTVDAWLIWQLTGGRRAVTDVTNASRTMLFNIHDLCWDPGLLDLFAVPAGMLPEVRSSSEVVAATSPEVLGAEVPIGGIAGDQQAATFGHLCFTQGSAKNTYGTGSFLMLPTGDIAVESQHGLLTTVAWRTDAHTTYALEGSIFTTGAAIDWLVDGLGILTSPSETGDLASSVPDTGGVCFVPALAGLGAPHWDQYARGALIGLTRGTTKEHIARATLEGIAYQVYDVVKALESDADLELGELRVDGGVSRSDFLMQFQADVLDVPVVRPQMAELTARGAAFLAGLATGFWPDLSAILELPRAEDTFEPCMRASERERLLERWHDAVRRSLQWESQEEGRPPR
jgi:glycerol kinase